MRLMVSALLLFCLSAIVSAYVRLKQTSYDVVVRSQPVGTSIFIDRLVLAHGGYISITPKGDADIPPSISDYMPAGLFTDFNIDIYWGDDLDVPAQTPVIVQILADNGDAFFDPAFDIPVRDAQGKTYEKTIILQ